MFRQLGMPPAPGDADPLPPDTAITSKPDPVSSSNVVFTFTSSDPDSLFMCSLNGAVASPCDATEGNLTPVQGQNTLDVYSVGPGLANDATPATYTWSVNDTKADSRFTVTPATATNSRNATFGWTGSNATSFKCKINAQPEQQNCTSPQSYDSTKTIEGLNTFTVTASNASGPDQYPAVYKWTVDSVPPPATAICTAVGNLPACRDVPRPGRANAQQNGQHQLQQPA